MNDPVIIFLLIATAFFLAVFLIGLKNIVEGALERCWHSWSPWDDPHNAGKDVVQLRTCKKCNAMEHRIVMPNATIKDIDEESK